MDPRELVRRYWTLIRPDGPFLYLWMTSKAIFALGFCSGKKGNDRIVADITKKLLCGTKDAGKLFVAAFLWRLYGEKPVMYYLPIPSAKKEGNGSLEEVEWRRRLFDLVEGRLEPEFGEDEQDEKVEYSLLLDEIEGGLEVCVTGVPFAVFFQDDDDDDDVPEVWTKVQLMDDLVHPMIEEKFGFDSDEERVATENRTGDNFGRIQHASNQRARDQIIDAFLRTEDD